MTAGNARCPIRNGHESPPSKSPSRGRTYDLTGPELLRLADAARIITEVTGLPVRYRAQTLKELLARP